MAFAQNLLIGLGATALISTSASDCSTPAPDVYLPEALDGYVLISDYGNESAVLIDMNAQVVNEWYSAGIPAKMLPGGYVLTGRGHNPDSPSANFDTIELVQVGWDGNDAWSFSNFDTSGETPSARQHHDFQREGSPVGYYSPGQWPLSQGNTLTMAHLEVDRPDISSFPLLDDVLYEVDWQGNRTGFEWHALDHFAEFGFDDVAKANIYTNPNVVDPGVGDLLHMNTASRLGENRWYDAGDTRFHPQNIITGSRSATFIFIIDHVTGALVWRIGPDFSSGRPESVLGQLQGTHHEHMIPRGLPGEGNILLFDNGGITGYGGTGYPQFPSRGYSRVLEFNPITLQIVWEYGSVSGADSFFSPYVSSVQRLPNGNTFIAIGNQDRMIEVTPDKRIVWDYDHQSKGGTYRAYRIPPEWLPEGANVAGYAHWEDLFPPQ